MKSEIRLGIVGGLGSVGAADIFYKMTKSISDLSGSNLPTLYFEQKPFHEPENPGLENASQSSRKIYAFDMINSFEEKSLNAVVLPCFISQTFINELQSEITINIVSIMDALKSYLQMKHPTIKKVGVLTSDYVISKRLFEEAFTAIGIEVILPSANNQKEMVMGSIYALDGLKRCMDGIQPLVKLSYACDDLVSQEAEIIIPGFTEISAIVEDLNSMGFPIIDSNLIYAQYAVSFKMPSKFPDFKIGIVGGVGPAATVDFLSKIIKNTPSSIDQDHIKIVIEQNPQIPDRAQNLKGEGADPTIPLYSVCKKLELASASVIAIPCNTAHAYIERIQRNLNIPIVDMLRETIVHVEKLKKKVGLLATSGTVDTGIYQMAADDFKLTLLVPDDEIQKDVMEAIYGVHGIKAGGRDAFPRDLLLNALEHLSQRGAEVVILGCTELPLLFQSGQIDLSSGKSLILVDPTEILAKTCVSLRNDL